VAFVVLGGRRWCANRHLAQIEPVRDRAMARSKGAGGPALTLLARCGLYLPAAHGFRFGRGERRRAATCRPPAWAYPAVSHVMSLFVVPIARGRARSALPEGRTHDLFVLSLPLSQGRIRLAMFAFSVVFFSTIDGDCATLALSTMVKATV